MCKTGGVFTEKFRWAYIGSGSIARSTAADITKGDHKIVSVFSRNFEKAEAFAREYGARAFHDFSQAVSLDCVDGVYIATPHTSHVEYAVKAMELGKPVLCEKPVGVTVKDVDTLTDAALKNNVYFCEAMWTWYNAPAHTVRDWVRTGRIGKIKKVINR